MSEIGVPSRRAGRGRRLRAALQDPATLRAWTVDVNDGVVATAGLLEGFTQAGASAASLVTAGVIATFAGGIALGGTRWAEMSSERDAQLRQLREAERGSYGCGSDATDGADATHGPRAGHGTDDAEEGARRARLASACVRRGLSPDLAGQVADQLLAHDPAGSRLEADLGIPGAITRSHVIWQSVDATVAFVLGSLLPLLISLFVPGRFDKWATVLVVVASLTVTSVVAARHNHAPVWRTVARSVTVGVASVVASFLAGTVLDL
ncbi:VIT1/CCC1 transporter family protein [Actinomyces polynesiensis]|uniref:VIT1/CCC1 transporter family protein n=1 Tax=Actinomyces polynesiensis TaxID=1325934 RepID=UPI0005B78C74|nr:VIT1/CCC1 transporter family protein [Actinomyces polynesiensis]